MISDLSLGAPCAQHLSIDVRPERRVVVVALAGELDVAGAPAVDAQLAELRDVGFEHVAVDLRGLEFLDSSGVELLLRWSRAAGSPRVSVIPGSPAVQRALELSGAVALLTLVRAADVTG